MAGVAATSLHGAEEALALIDVEYEVLPPVLDVVEAMKDDATLIHEDLKTDSLGAKSEKSSNIGSHYQWVLGDLDKGFEEADVVIERTLNTKMVHQGYIEPQNATVLWNADDRITIRCSNQGRFRCARSGVQNSGCARVQDSGDSVGDRWWVRWKNPGLS